MEQLENNSTFHNTRALKFKVNEKKMSKIAPAFCTKNLKIKENLLKHLASRLNYNLQKSPKKMKRCF